MKEHRADWKDWARWVKPRKLLEFAAPVGRGAERFEDCTPTRLSLTLSTLPIAAVTVVVTQCRLMRQVILF